MLKRIFDIIFSSLGLIFLSPVFIIVSIWIKLDSSGPILFRQRRVGKDEQIFKIHKFRTMVVDAQSKGCLTVGVDSRVTKSGRFLRKSKIDELPQLIDVLIGNMSFVGPRPEVEEFIAEYPVDVRTRVLSIRPGITDRASIEMVDENILLSGYEDPRQAYIDIILPIKQKYYLEYVNNQSLILDVSLIIKTLKKIVSSKR
ncbi:glycosyl transferase [Vibrio campbellii]|uniref:sugar transferase n=1 Tax=Vibrio campbellii TaxID=680 RepID=UPI000A2FBF18|nr:sugar transferase [Vibrio campbellii]ARR45705.1 glycosyl transferase [Vibrio campbellii]